MLTNTVAPHHIEAAGVGVDIPAEMLRYAGPAGVGYEMEVRDLSPLASAALLERVAHSVLRTTMPTGSPTGAEQRDTGRPARPSAST